MRTATELLGKVTLMLTGQITLGQHDGCDRCRRRLVDLCVIYLADCGRYCSRGCAEEHADAIAMVSMVTAFEAGAIRAERLFRAGLVPPTRPDDDH